MVVGLQTNIPAAAPPTETVATDASATTASAPAHIAPVSTQDSQSASVAPESSVPVPCSMNGCTSPAASALHLHPLCIGHFFARTYATLEHLEASHRDGANTPEPAMAEARALLNDCSVQAFRVSMHSENLTNLDRGRLLDILLWAGELSETLRRSAKFSRPMRPATAKPASQETRSSAANS